MGWRGAALLSAIALIVAVLVTRQWLRDAGRDGAFAILIPAYAGALFFGRIAMSDVPSAAVVAATLWLTWRAERGPWWAFSAGAAAGASLLLRETNAVILGPILLGALLRGRGSRTAMLAGGLTGVAMRLWISRELFGSALYLRDPGFGFSLRAMLENLPVYALLLLVLFPLGAALPWLYRGERRAELGAAVALYVAIFLFYDYSAARESGTVRGLILTSRYLIPLLPVLVFMAADVYPRLARGAPRLGALKRPAELAVVVAAFAVHPMVARLESDARSIVAAIQRDTEEAIPVLTNHRATLKYLNPVYGARHLILRSHVSARDVRGFVAKHGALSIVFLDRDDSEPFRRDAAENARLLDELGQRCALVVQRDARHDSGVRLRVLRVDRCTERGGEN
jgi:hypothetical protein